MQGDIRQSAMAAPWLNGNGCMRETERGGEVYDVQRDQYKVKT
jgi:hypothetical protein